MMFILSRVIFSAFALTSLLPFSFSLSTHPARVISNRGFVAICLSLHYHSISNNVFVSAEQIGIKNGHARGLEGDQYPSNSRTIKDKQDIDIRISPMKSKAKEPTTKSKINNSKSTKAPAGPTKGPGGPPQKDTSSLEEDSSVCFVDATTDGTVPGVTALEYLGMGYNLIEGNPRGSDITELDPGFRSGVILLEQPKNRLSSDNKLAIPLGVELRYLTSCEFSSKATELLDVSDYQRRLSRESRLSVGGGISGAFKFISGSLSASYSRSERFKTFRNDRFRTQNSEFESSAICTEFEGRLNSYYDHQTRDNFKVALSTLPYPFDSTSEEHELAYLKFIAEYGTHYVSKVVLGAKQIYTVVMKSSAVSKLREQQVDVATTIGAKAMFQFSKGGDDGKSLSSSGDNNNLVNIVNSPNEKSEKSSAASAGGNLSVEKSTSKSDFKRQLDEIKKEVTEVREVNIGGTTPSEEGDWREWAKSARDRPMPVIYDLEPLWDLMDEEMEFAFKEAINHIYGKDFDDESDSEKIKNALNLGVAAPNGEAISTYSFDRLSGLSSRTILRRPSDVNPFYMYDIKWKGSNRAVSAVFASTIRDNIAPNRKEDELELGFFDNRFSEQLSMKNSLNTFGLSLEPGIATVAVFEIVGDDGENIASENMLNSFTYLTADNVEEIDEFVVGVVHPQGYALNKEFGVDPGFTIEMENDRDFRIIFTKNFTSPPTFIVSPMWFAEDGIYPQNSAEIQIGLADCSKSECEVVVGGVQLTGKRTSYETVNNDIFLDALKLINPFYAIADAVAQAVLTPIPNHFLPFTSSSKALTGVNPLVNSDLDTDVVDDSVDQFLGFSFMAVDPMFNVSNISESLKMIHGIVTIDLNGTQSDNGVIPIISNFTGSGYTASARFMKSQPFDLFTGTINTAGKDTTEKVNVAIMNQTVGGVRIDFNKAFKGIPTVLASPITGALQFGRAEVTDLTIIERVKRFIGIRVGSSTTTIVKKAEMLTQPSVLVEHITERSTFIKAGFVHTMDAKAMLNGGKTSSIYEPVSFHFVAIGPSLVDDPTDSF